MKTLVMNGNPDSLRPEFDRHVDEFVRNLESQGHEVTRVDLRDLSIKYCIGCWSCWWATPGKCVFKDDMLQIYPTMVATDLVVWASPLVLGNVSALTKAAQDRFIPLVHPYIEIVDGECHHRKRYANNAKVGLLVGPTAEDTVEDLAIVRQLFERFAKNTRSEFSLFSVTQPLSAEVHHESLVG